MHNIRSFIDSSGWKLFIIILGMCYSCILMATEQMVLSGDEEFLLNINIALGFVEKSQTTTLFFEQRSLLERTPWSIVSMKVSIKIPWFREIVEVQSKIYLLGGNLRKIRKSAVNIVLHLNFLRANNSSKIYFQ